MLERDDVDLNYSIPHEIWRVPRPLKVIRFVVARIVAMGLLNGNS